MNIADFVSRWNTQEIEALEGHNLTHILNDFADDLADGYCAAYADEKRTHISLSQVHKPVCLSLLTKHGIHDKSSTNMAAKTHLFLGHMYESLIISWMLQSDVDIRNRQEEVELYGIKGHIDFYLPEEDMVVDVKSMSPYYHRTFSEFPDDNRGYITQILAYRKAMGCSRAAILAVNKLNNELTFHEIKDDEDYRRYNEIIEVPMIEERLEQVCKIINDSTSIEDVFNYPLEILSGYIDAKAKSIPENCKYDTRTKYWVITDRKGVLVHKYTEDETIAAIRKEYDYVVNRRDVDAS